MFSWTAFSRLPSDFHFAAVVANICLRFPSFAVGIWEHYAVLTEKRNVLWWPLPVYHCHNCRSISKHDKCVWTGLSGLNKVIATQGVRIHKDKGWKSWIASIDRSLLLQNGVSIALHSRRFVISNDLSVSMSLIRTTHWESWDVERRSMRSRRIAEMKKIG